jgi:hypothetical protein
MSELTAQQQGLIDRLYNEIAKERVFPVTPLSKACAGSGSGRNHQFVESLRPFLYEDEDPDDDEVKGRRSFYCQWCLVQVDQDGLMLNDPEAGFIPEVSRQARRMIAEGTQ